LPGEPTFFATPDEWRAWLTKHHATAGELSVGFWKTSTGKPSITWPQSVDEALCFGWIDGVRHRIDDEAYRIRFTPRKASGNWSQVNLKRFAELTAAGRVAPAGQAAHDTGKHRTARYSFENPMGELTPPELEQFKARAKAWADFEARPVSYRRPALWWVVSAKRPETRAKRLAQLIDDHADGRKIALLRRKPDE
jgi:uncharacterized protein YdeI (YjbR/CyaY-like superfamily)